MQPSTTTYDVAIIGGGLAGLSTAIQLARKGYSVVVLEKEKYPFHKVCGEYISMESWEFLQNLGLPLPDLGLPIIDTFILTSPNGNSFTTKLPLGGFGISRYKIDYLLSELARENGVILLDETKAEQINFENEEFLVRVASKKLGHQELIAKICCGAFGKRSNLDMKWKREFINRVDAKQNNYVAVKYHIKTSWPDHLIGLHNFSNGYCGISKIEDDKFCLCYLTTAANLKQSNNSIAQMQEGILYKNPALKKIFLNSQFLDGFPVAISQISFSKKSLVEQHVLLLGDAAGMITPLCGNGMSMALHASKIVAVCMDNYLTGKSPRAEMENLYKKQWETAFAKRLKAGRILQGFFGSEKLSNLFVSVFKAFSFLAKGVIRKTHGKPF